MVFVVSETLSRYTRSIVLWAGNSLREPKAVFCCFRLFAICFGILSVSLISDKYEIFGSNYAVIYLFLPSAIAVMCGFQLNFYPHNLRNSSSELLFNGVISSLAGTLSLTVLDSYFSGRLAITELTLIFFMFLSASMSIRLSWKILHKKFYSFEKKNIAIYGAGQTGIQLLNSLRSNHHFSVWGFIDDNKKYSDILISGKKIFTFNEFVSNQDLSKIDIIFFAIPSIPARKRRKILDQLSNLQIEVRILPDFKDILDQKFDINSFRKLKVKDLLGREEITPFKDLLSINITGKEVLVTGGGGSIGSELCRQILANSLKLFILDNSENNLFEIYEELFEAKEIKNIKSVLVPVLTSINNKLRLDALFAKNNIQTVFHAAAYKHVPLVEYNKIDAISNNIFGTKILLAAASKSSVKTFVLISSDKAVRPTNIMGATKRIGELIAFEQNQRSPDMRICAVRFGNVIGSSGSVIPIFEKQIENGGPITLTHKDVTRYFMTIKEAATLVIQAAGLCKNDSEIYLLDMGSQ